MKKPTRSERFDLAIAKLAEARSEFEALRDELQDWLDNMPENLQGGVKAEELYDAISTLEDAVTSCEDIEENPPVFPAAR